LVNSSKVGKDNRASGTTKGEKEKNLLHNEGPKLQRPLGNIQGQTACRLRLPGSMK